MYNLIITSEVGAWDGAPYDMDMRRIFEYTSDVLKETYGNFDRSAINELINFPALFAYEKNINGNARVGRIVKVVPNGRYARIEYSFLPDIPVIPMERMKSLVWELDIRESEDNRTHWALKEVDLFSVLVDAGLIIRSQVLILTSYFDGKISRNDRTAQIKPTVFRLPESGQERDLVSVMIPFTNEFDPVFQQMQSTCRLLDMRCERADDTTWRESEIIQDIFSLIFRSIIVICDFSRKNPNVFYEAGIAHTLGRVVIPIVQQEEDIPFNLKQHRHIKYENSPEGLHRLSRQLQERLSTLKQSTP
ncbi:MAG: hypothetical protein HQM03_18145 [Magnetococcales bacterium]|nr:hypothetical protein [Magnetococcales bacterium]